MEEYTEAELKKLKHYVLKRGTPDDIEALKNFEDRLGAIQSRLQELQDEKQKLRAEEKAIKSAIHPTMNRLMYIAMRELHTKTTADLYRYIWDCCKNGTLLL